MKQVVVILCSVILLAASSGGLDASTIAVEFSAVEVDNIRPDKAAAQALGFKFAPTTDMDVLELGIYSNGDDISAYDHDNNPGNDHINTLKAGLYDKDGHQLGGVEINSGIAVVDFFRWAALAEPVRLKQGQVYFVMAEVGLTEYIWDPIDFSANPEIGYLNGAFKENREEGDLFWLLGDPDSFVDYHEVDAILGANFKYETSEVPVPSALLLMGSGCLGLIGLGRRHYKK